MQAIKISVYVNFYQFTRNFIDVYAATLLQALIGGPRSPRKIPAGANALPLSNPFMIYSNILTKFSAKYARFSYCNTFHKNYNFIDLFQNLEIILKLPCERYCILPRVSNTELSLISLL